MIIERYKWLLKVLVFTGWFLPAGMAVPQKADIKLTPDSMMIGQQASLEMIIEVPEAGLLVWPGITDTLTADIEIVRFGRPDTIQQSGGMVIYRQEHIITAWKEGYFVIPPIAFRSVVGIDTLVVFSDAILLEVTGLEIDPDTGLRDIKTIFGIPVTIRDILPWIAGIIFLATVIWFFIRYLKQRKKSVPAQTIWEKPDIPAHIAAISSLEKLKSKKLWQQGRFKPYHSELTDILRMYIFKRSGMHAPEMTTTEIVAHLSNYFKDELAVSGLRQILEMADLVKFARYKPEPRTNEQSMEQAFNFVEMTKEKENHAD